MKKTDKLKCAKFFLNNITIIKIGMHIFVLLFAISWWLDSDNSLKEPILATVAAFYAIIDILIILYEKKANKLIQSVL